MTPERRTRLFLDKHFVRDEVAGYIPLHYNQLEQDLPEEFRQAQREALGNAEQIAADRAANTTDPREAAVASRIANDIKQLRE